MNSDFRFRLPGVEHRHSSLRARCLFGFLLLLAVAAPAFPPAPHHTIYGVVRDEFGDPLTATNATILFETPSGQHLSAPIIPFLHPGENYEIHVPMDSRKTPDSYKSTAQFAGVPYRIRVKIGNTVYLPIEMSSTNLVTLGSPSK